MTNVAKTLEALRGSIEAENDMAKQGGGSKFTVQPLPQPGRCLARFLVHHNYANGLNISGTEVALVFGGQVVAKHPRFDYELEGDSVSGSAGAHNWRAGANCGGSGCSSIERLCCPPAEFLALRLVYAIEGSEQSSVPDSCQRNRDLSTAHTGDGILINPDCSLRPNVLNRRNRLRHFPAPHHCKVNCSRRLLT